MHKINHADIKEWAANYQGEPFDAILCDPPYELSNDGKASPNGVFAEFMFPDYTNRHTQTLSESELTLLIKQVLVLGLIAGNPTVPTTMPVSTVTLDKHSLIREIDVKDGSELSEVVSKYDGTLNRNAELDEHITNIQFKLTDTAKLFKILNEIGSGFYSSGIGIGTKSGIAWSMLLFGNQYTEKYPINIKSTTKTTTSSTTTSVILNWLTGLLTNESTLGVNLEMENGGSPVKSVESSNTLTATINDQTALALGVNNAQASKRLLISVSDGKNFHSTVKPLSLTKYLATLIKPPTGGRLLVPFSGSGSEMIGALQAGWEYVEGVELTEEYIPIAEARIKYWLERVEEESKQVALL